MRAEGEIPDSRPGIGTGQRTALRVEDVARVAADADQLFSGRQGTEADGAGVQILLRLRDERFAHARK